MQHFAIWTVILMERLMVKNCVIQIAPGKRERIILRVHLHSYPPIQVEIRSCPTTFSIISLLSSFSVLAGSIKGEWWITSQKQSCQGYEAKLKHSFKDIHNFQE